MTTRFESKMRPEAIGTFAGLASYALMSQSPATTEVLSVLTPSRPNVSLGSAATEWRAKRLIAEVKMEWQEAQSVTRDAEIEAWDEWTMAKVLEEMRFAPPESSVPIRIVVSGIRQGKPHRASMEEFDYELIESLQGEL